ncbi:MAG: cation:proton antiporter [Thermoprotei archaeon]|nr:MAG: cation:proton antiporter [Thermoprotei archaeon]
MYISIILGSLPILIMALAFLLPVLSIFIKRKVVFDICFLFIAFLSLILSAEILFSVVGTQEYLLYPFGGWPPPLGIVYVADYFSATLATTISFVILTVAMYTVWYTRHLEGYVWLYTLILALEAGLLGVIYSGDIFNLYVMLEVVAISSYGLVAFYTFRRRPLASAARYSILGIMFLTFYFLAVVIIYSSLGTLNIGDLALKLRPQIIHLQNYTIISAYSSEYTNTIAEILEETALPLSIALLISIWVFTFISALFPNHFWLPDAHSEAPTPASAILSGLVVKVGVYASIRFLYTIFGPNTAFVHIRELLLNVLMLLGIISSLFASIMMALQDDSKRMLAYSTIVNIGFIYMGISMGSVMGLASAIYHLINHAIGKALIFISIGLLIRASRTRNLYGMAGIGRQYPLVTFIIIMSSLHLIGLPPFGGFFSKLLLYQSFIEKGALVPALTVVIASAIVAYGYFKLIEAIWHTPPISTITISRRPIPILSGISMVIMTASILMLGFFAPIIIDSVNAIAHEIVNEYTNYIEAISKLATILTPKGVGLP